MLFNQAPRVDGEINKSKKGRFCFVFVMVGGWHDLAVWSQSFFFLPVTSQGVRVCVRIRMDGAGELGDDGLPFQPISWV